MDIQYRWATQSDIEWLARTRVVLADEESGLNEDEKKALYENCKAAMQKGMAQNRFLSLLALDGEACIGTASACLYEVLPGKKLPHGQNAYIQNVYVAPACRRRGVGKKLLSLLVSKLREMGYARITLHATQSGEKLFGGCGFQSEEALKLTAMVYIPEV